MQNHRYSIKLVAWFLLPWWTAAAQDAPASGPASDLGDLTLEQLMDIRIDKVSGASKYEQKVTRAPASVTIVTADEIAKFGYLTLADVMRSVSGFYVTYERNYEDIGVRGFDRPGDFDTRVLLLVDGHRMNDDLYSSALIGAEEMIDLDLIERVEVIRGPSSSIYGNSAFFGVISVVTRQASQIDGLEIATGYGSLDTRRARVTYGKQFKNGVDLVVSGSTSDSDGNARLYYPEFDTPQNNHGIAENSDAERAENLYGRLGWGGFTLSGGYSRRTKHVPTASYGTAFDDGREVTTDTRAFAELKFEHDFGNDLELATRASWDRYDYFATYPYNYAAPDAPRFIVLNHDDNKGTGAGADFQLTKKFLKQVVVFGGEYRRALSLRQSNYNDDPKTYTFFTDNTAHSSGLYLQDEITLRRDLLLNAGLRYDSFSTFGSTLNPRLAAIYSPTAESTFKLLYGSAFRAPNAYELYYQSPSYAKPSFGLEPETIRTVEGVYERYMARNLRFSASIYHYGIHGLISQVLDPKDGLLVFQNQGNPDANGVELEMEGRYERGMVLRASYALQRIVNRQSGFELDNSPRQMAKFNAIVPLYREVVYAGIEAQYLSSLETISGKEPAGFALVNVTLFSATIVKGLTASASVYNLFDRAYAYPGSTGDFQDLIPQDGRSLRVKLTYRF